MNIVNTSEYPVTDIVLQYHTDSKQFESRANPLVAANTSCAVISFEDSSEIDALVSMLTDFKKYVDRSYAFVSEISRIDRGKSKNNKTNK